MTTEQVNDLLDFAIDKEQEAHEFYLDLANKAAETGIKKLFIKFAKEELGHKAKLVGVKHGKRLFSGTKKAVNLKIADYSVEVKPRTNIDYKGALLLAMQREKAAFRLYSDIAKQTEDLGLKQLFLVLAQEELEHKSRFEVEYNETFSWSRTEQILREV